jgi:hypothetical protein
MPADSCVRIGRIDHVLPAGTRAGPLAIELDLTWEGGHVSNAYLSQVGGIRKNGSRRGLGRFLASGRRAPSPVRRR